MARPEERPEDFLDDVVPIVPRGTVGGDSSGVELLDDVVPVQGYTRRAAGALGSAATSLISPQSLESGARQVLTPGASLLAHGADLTGAAARAIASGIELFKAQNPAADEPGLLESFAREMDASASYYRKFGERAFSESRMGTSAPAQVVGWLFKNLGPDLFDFATSRAVIGAVSKLAPAVITSRLPASAKVVGAALPGAALGVPEAVRGYREGGVPGAVERGAPAALTGIGYEIPGTRLAKAAALGAASAIDADYQGATPGQAAAAGGVGAVVGALTGGVRPGVRTALPGEIQPPVDAPLRAKIRPITVSGRPTGRATVTGAGDFGGVRVEIGDVVKEDGTILRRGAAGTEALPRSRLQPGVAQEGNVFASREAGAAEQRHLPTLAESEAKAESMLATDFSGEAPAGHRASGINIDRIDGPDSFKAEMETFVQAQNTEWARRGVVSTEQTRADALRILEEQIGAREGALVRRGAALNESELTAIRMRNAQVFREWRSKAQGIRDLRARGETPSQVLRQEFQRLTRLAEASVQDTLGASAEAGRALRSMRNEIEEGGMSPQMLRAFQQAFAQPRAGVRGLRERLSSDEAMDSLAEMVGRIESEQGAAHFAREVSKVKDGNALVELYLNALLTGPQTHVVNAVSNALVSATSIPETLAAGAMGGLRSSIAAALGRTPPSERVYVREALGRTYALFESMPQAMKAFKDGFADIASATGKVEVGVGIRGPAGPVVRTPTRALNAMDAFWKEIAKRQELNALGFREGIEKGLEGTELRDFARRFATQPSKEASAAASREAAYRTFTGQLGKRGRAIQTAVSHPLLRILFPFIRTPINIFKYGIRRLPGANFALKEVREELRAGGAARDRVLGEMAFGGSVAAWAALQAGAGKITGAKPSDPGQRALWYASGRRPYAFRVPARIAKEAEKALGMKPGELGSGPVNDAVGLAPNGDLWLSYGRLEPISTILGIAADGANVSGHLKRGEWDDAAAALMVSVRDNLRNKTFLQGMSAIMDALNERDPVGTRNFVTNTIGNLLQPVTALSQAARLTDPILRETRSTLNRWMSRVPGLSNDLPAKQDPWGNDIYLDRGLGPDWASPIYANRVDTDRATEEALRLKAHFGRPNRKMRMQGEGLTIAEIDLDTLPGQPYVELQKLTGQIAHRMISTFVNSPEYQRTPDILKKSIMERLYASARSAARDQVTQKILAQHPNLLQESLQKKIVEPLLGESAR